MKRIRSRSVLIGAAACASVSVFGYLFNSRVELAFASVLYLLLTIFVAWQARLRAAIVTAVWATVCLDFFFTEPKLALRMISLADFWSVVAFASVALLVSHLSSRIRQQAENLKTQEKHQRALYELSSAALSLDWGDGFGEQLASLVRKTLHAEFVHLWTVRDERNYIAGWSHVEPGSIRAAFMAGRDFDLSRNDIYVRLLKSGVRDIGLLWIKAADTDPFMADSVVPIISSALERARALNNEVTAQSEQLSEQLRTSVLDGLAHAFKTPLTTIALSSAGLAELPDMAREQRSGLANIIRKEADRLNEITQQVLKTARLEWNQVLSRREISLSTLLEEVIHSLGSEAQMRIHVTSRNPALVEADPSVLKIAFEQILENALKYGQAGTEIPIEIRSVKTLVSVSIHNTGSYIQPEEQELIFTRFYRSPSMAYRAAGTGIGLSVARHAVEAHSGKILVQSDIEAGTTFRIDLPAIGEEK